MRSLRNTAILLAIFSGCGSDVANGSSTAATTTAGDISSGSTTLTTGTDTMLGDESSVGGPQGECILWIDECGEGRKCMPYSAQEDRIPDATVCCSTIDNPVPVGEPCSIFGYDGSCMDTCEQGSMCIVDDSTSLTGLCRAFCDPVETGCPSHQTCKPFFELLPTVPNVPLCMDRCDPVLQDCPQPLWQCIPDTVSQAGQSGFICVPPAPEEPKSLFDDCGLANDCARGLVCINDERVPGCQSIACCSAFCSLAEGDSACVALHPDLQCIDWMSPDPEWVDVGVCALPDP